MDDIKPNQSLDGMQGGKPANAPSMDGFNAPSQNAVPSQSSTSHDQFNDADYATEMQQVDNQNMQNQHTENGKKGGSNKGLKTTLTIFIILFIAAAAAAVYFYMKSNEEPVQEANVNVTKLQQENESLTYDNKTLTTQNSAYKVQISGLTTTAQQLKSKCGTACKSINVPQ